MAVIEINRNPAPVHLKRFSWFWFPLFYLVLGVVLHLHGVCFQVCCGVWAAGLAVSCAGFFFPAVTKHVFVATQVVFFPAGWIVSHIIMFIIYFGVITPIALVFKLIGRDPLLRRFSRDRDSYWRPLRSDRPPEDYFKQW